MIAIDSLALIDDKALRKKLVRHPQAEHRGNSLSIPNVDEEISPLFFYGWKFLLELFYNSLPFSLAIIVSTKLFEDLIPHFRQEIG